MRSGAGGTTGYFSQSVDGMVWYGDIALEKRLYWYCTVLYYKELLDLS